MLDANLELEGTHAEVRELRAIVSAARPLFAVVALNAAATIFSAAHLRRLCDDDCRVADAFSTPLLFPMIFPHVATSAGASCGE